MKLLLDENLSDRIVSPIQDLFPGSSHVKHHGLTETDDGEIWFFAAREGYAIVSKDSDFYQRSLLLGSPPKFIFLKVGNCPSSRITAILRDSLHRVKKFLGDPNADMLILA